MSSVGPFNPLPSEIRRRQALAEQEARDGVNWLEDCPASVGHKVYALLEDATNARYRVLTQADRYRTIGSADGLIETDAWHSLENGDGSAEERLDVVAAVMYAFAGLAEHDDEMVEVGGWDSHEWEKPWYRLIDFTETVNDFLLGSRVNWEFVDGRFLPRTSSVLHEAVVQPATILLDSDPKFSRASAGLQLALTRLSENKPDAAITDAAAAIQELFRSLGAKGNSIGDQLNAAQRSGLITAADRALMKPIIDWINADRSDHGNAHAHRDGDVTRADAWLSIHVAAALAVRLSNQEPREIMAVRARREEQRRLAEAATSAPHEAGTSTAAWEAPGRWDETPF
ncbi:hypothetical protein KNO15_08875 [Leifsonia shinshuensis]|uniref:hypothetical protein n=1 Tax=Leifsonia shinshuensis TaxID=150026 RepID=UPI001F50E158|nr:hypothetical protein [Leifsonia shinshuensis]MCI0156808.1 hypothetical protein [Leifsonia shinshuensis]